MSVMAWTSHQLMYQQYIGAGCTKYDANVQALLDAVEFVNTYVLTEAEG